MQLLMVFLTFDVDSRQDVLEGCSMEQIADFLLRLQGQKGRERTQFSFYTRKNFYAEKREH